ncbi:MAG: transposon-encoded TnpW family protein [Candidatus Gastranaerophilaceae bacterium]|nr:transposon-encoded TnpW family protein [Christensenellales bacterium]
MNRYIDDNAKEEFTEDITIREALKCIDDMLASWSREERLAFFEAFAKPKDIDFVKEINGIYYVVRSHFSRDNNEDILDKVNRLLDTDI